MYFPLMTGDRSDLTHPLQPARPDGTPNFVNRVCRHDRHSENAFINAKGRNYTITSQVELKDGTTNAVIISKVGRFGGSVLYMKGGKVHHEYKFFGLEPTNIEINKVCERMTMLYFLQGIRNDLLFKF